MMAMGVFGGIHIRAICDVNIILGGNKSKIFAKYPYRLYALRENFIKNIGCMLCERNK
jgi:hypothetical protein